MMLNKITVSVFSILFLSCVMVSFAPANFVSNSTALAQTATDTRDAKQIVDEAKSQGVIGETVSGYLAVADQTAKPAIVNAMNEINIRRKALYTKLARKQNVQIEVVAALTAEKVIDSAESGEKFLNADGQWIVK